MPNPFAALWSVVLSWLDLVTPLIVRSKAGLFFQDGYGVVPRHLLFPRTREATDCTRRAAAVPAHAVALNDFEEHEQHIKEIEFQPSQARFPTELPASVPIHIPARPADGAPWRGRMVSPLASTISAPNSRVMHFEIVAGKEVSEPRDLKGKRVAIFLAATGDEGYSSRRKRWALPLLEQHGIVSVIIQIAFYGARRAPGQDTFAVRSISDIEQQATICFTEAPVLAKHVVHALGAQAVCFAGGSFGGSMAACSGLHADIDAGVVALAPEDGPRTAFVTGLLHKVVDWQSLATAHGGSVERTVKDVDEVLRGPEASLPLVVAGRTGKHRLVYAQIVGDRDLVVPPESSQFLFDHLKQVDPHATSVQISGGHGVALLFADKLFLDTIAGVFDRLASS